MPSPLVFVWYAESVFTLVSTIVVSVTARPCGSVIRPLTVAFVSAYTLVWTSRTPATNRKAKARRQNMEFIVPPTERFLTRHLSEEQKMFSIWIENCLVANRIPLNGYPLVMIRRSAQVGIQKPSAFGGGTAVRWFESHEYGVNVFQDTRIVDLEHP